MHQPAKHSSFLDKNRYLVLLLSFLLLIFGNTFTPYSPITNIVFIYINFIVGLLVFYHKNWMRYIILSIIIISVMLDILEAVKPFNFRSMHTTLYLLFFILVVIEVFKDVLYVKTVSRELLAAALCGFVLLCLVSTFIFSFIDIYHPNSFSNAGKGIDIIDDLNYFSFTTMFTLGFGDITPLTLVAKRAVMLMGLIGHFYTVFITSIIIGKYLSARK